MQYIVKKDDVGLKIKEILTDRIGISSRLYTKLKKNRKIFVNNENRLPHELVNIGDVVEVILDYEKNTFEIQKKDIEIIYEDDAILVVNKDPFCVVHPTKGHPNGTLMNFAAYYLSGKGEDCKIRFVNRLDRDTSGIVIMAKNQFIHHKLSEGFKENGIKKEYIALVDGVMKDDNGIIDFPIERESEDSIYRIVRDDGKPSKTEYIVIKRYKEHTLIKIKLHTGRTHQIRVHLKYIGHSIVGDVLYNKKSELIDRQFLHCAYMEFKHPLTKKIIYLEAKLKDDLRKAQDYLEEL